MDFTSIQKQAFYYAQRVDHPAFFITMRGGKTILTIQDLIYQNLFPVLIVAPLSCLFGWELDLRVMNVSKSEYSLCIGTKNQKLKQLKNTSFILINKEFFLSVPDILNIGFKAVVLDESTCIKNPRAKITNFFLRNFKTIKRRYVLTGTPMPKNEFDIFCQLQFLNPNILNEKNYWVFLYKWFYEPYPYTYKLKPIKKPIFYERLNKYCFFANIDDIRKTPLKTERIVRTCAMRNKAIEVYKNLKENFILKIDENNKTTVNWKLQQLVYLRKLCSGFAMTADNKSVLIDNCKYILLKNTLLEEIPDYKTIILCNFYDEVYEIEKIFKQMQKNYGILVGISPPMSRKKVLYEFQHGTLQYLITNVGCVSHGVTLSKADITIEFSPIFGEKRLQAELRGTDIYTDNKQSILHIIAKGTIEEYFYTKMNKEISQQKLMWGLIKYLKTEG